MVLHYKIVKSELETLQLSVNLVTKGVSRKIHHKQIFQASNATSWKRMDVILQSNVEFQVTNIACLVARPSKHILLCEIQPDWFLNKLHD